MERANSTNSVDPANVSVAIAQPASRASKLAPASKLDEWQRFFLDRLEYLLAQQRQAEGQEATEASLLSSKAVYSTYLDCQEQGVGDIASQLLADKSATKPSAN